MARAYSATSARWAFEGIVSKRLGSRYRSGRSPTRVVFLVRIRARPPEALRLRHHGEYKRAIASQGEGMKIQRRTLLAAGLTGMAWTATQGLAAASSTRTRFVFHVSSTWGSLLDWLVDRGYAPITAELEKRGFPSMLVHGSVRGSDTPNQDRASAVVKALQDVTDHVVIVGISNQGNFLPLVAAARPIRRVVYVNALIPRPGKAFIEVCQTERSPSREA